jgi:hypothetical protein
MAINEVEFTVVLRRLRHGKGESMAWEVEVKELDGSEYAKVWGAGPHAALAAAVPYMACHSDGIRPA